MSNGTRQGGVLSPYLFYLQDIREMLGAIVDSGIGCSIGGVLSLLMSMLMQMTWSLLLPPGKRTSVTP